jgi:enoyl-CoA hydratase/carnithine racemase
VTARRAHEIGLVHEVVAAADLESTTYALARAIAQNAPLSLAGMKAVIQRAISGREGIEHGDLAPMIARARKSADAREGERAMLEKRAPQFRGE